jgi:peptide/nickel transport system permease protein
VSASPVTQSSRLSRSMPSAWRDAARLSLLIGLFIVLGMYAVGLLAPLFGIGDPLKLDYEAALLPPSITHPFGTDNLGRDMLVRVIYGARVDLTLGFVTATISMLIGMALGVYAGYFGGIRESLIMRTVDAVLSLPFLVLVLAIVAAVGPGLVGVYVAIIAVSWTIYARISYSQMLVLREKQFILAARTLAFSDARIVFKHALPNIFGPNIAWLISDIIANILGLAILSYLGVGIQPPDPEWGALIADGQTYLRTAWWISTIPGLVLVVVGIGFLLIGDWFTTRLAGNTVAQR